MPSLWVQAKTKGQRKTAVVSAKLVSHTCAYKCTSFTEELLTAFHFDVSLRSTLQVLQQVQIGFKEESCSTKGEVPLQVLTEAR